MVNRVTDKGIMSGWKTDGTLHTEFARGIARLLQVEPSLWKYKGIYTRDKNQLLILNG